MCIGSMEDFNEEVAFEQALEGCVHWVVKGGGTFHAGAEAQKGG